MSSETKQMRSVISLVDDFFEGVCAPLREWLPRLQAQLSIAEMPMSGSALIELALPGARKVFETVDRPFAGVGFCGSTTILSEGNTLAWWLGPEQHLLASATLGPGQAVMDFEHLEWFRVPRDTAKENISGPFIDSLCSKQLTLTASVPMVVDGQFWGVACADVLVASIEKALFPHMGGMPNAVLVNARGQVVVSVDPDWVTGDRVPGVAKGVVADDSRAVLRSERFPFALVLLKG